MEEGDIRRYTYIFEYSNYSYRIAANPLCWPSSGLQIFLASVIVFIVAMKDPLMLGAKQL